MIGDDRNPSPYIIIGNIFHIAPALSSKLIPGDISLDVIIEKVHIRQAPSALAAKFHIKWERFPANITYLVSARAKHPLLPRSITWIILKRRQITEAALPREHYSVCNLIGRKRPKVSKAVTTITAQTVINRKFQ